MPLPVRLPPPVAAAAASILAAVDLRRYLYWNPRESTSMATSAHRNTASAAAVTLLVLSAKSPEDQQLLASSAGSISLDEGESGGGGVTVSLAPAAGVDAGFDAGAYMGALRARRFGRWMLWSPRMGSTHDLVSQNFAKLPVGVVCVADVQFKGRGRSKNVWESPPGCLMFSFTSQMSDARIGLNVDNEEPTTCLNAALRKVNADSPGLKQEDILASFFNKFEDLFEIFTNQGFKALEERYYNSWLHSGQRVIVQDVPEGEGQSVDSVVTIQTTSFQGLTPSGYLHAIGDDGKSCELHPDGNRGLIRRKFKA
ncbi:hypothetical protein BRADI_2g08160v3 [Brachypodium distachyon]|uniref:BPL/LPL catalytic domain-containing protein n=1 Tax=Brachypodium distachyon TaxID=15368 RepID=A0A0Q3ISU7_BRADI|nr:hypothetical protein BRADI_2g08160v3 [Brachypodium distachyon]